MRVDASRTLPCAHARTRPTPPPSHASTHARTHARTAPNKHTLARVQADHKESGGSTARMRAKIADMEAVLEEAERRRAASEAE